MKLKKHSNKTVLSNNNFNIYEVSKYSTHIIHKYNFFVFLVSLFLCVKILVQVQEEKVKIQIKQLKSRIAFNEDKINKIVYGLIG